MEVTRFSFVWFVLAIATVLGLVGGTNLLIDPLWYQHGNQLYGKNFAFNERVSKANLLRRTAATHNYDCLILGSSRVTALRPSQFSGLNCFNLALKGAKIPEIVQFAKFAIGLGVEPTHVFVGVDEFVFIGDDRDEEERLAEEGASKITGTPSAFHAFLSLDVLTFSAMTIVGLSPDPDAYYDSKFEASEFSGNKYAKPVFENKPDLTCTFKMVKSFAQLRELFPNARVVGYAPPMAPYYRLSDVYSRNLLDCTAEAFHRVAKRYDAFLDFAIPSEITVSDTTSYDGHHFSPAANDRVAQALIDTKTDLAIDVKALGLAEYQDTLHTRLQKYLTEVGNAEAWERLAPQTVER